MPGDAHVSSAPARQVPTPGYWRNMESLLQVAALLPRELIIVVAVLAVLRLAASVLRRPASAPVAARLAQRPAMERRTQVGSGSGPRPRYSGSGPDWSSIVLRRPLPGGAGSVKPAARAAEGRKAA